MSDDWNVESYRTDFESDEHWELRKNFMLAHKDRLSEDEIVCLAQVFVNIEFLGCRYPDETMKKVAELAKGVVESYREKKKNCLKRTFVAASEAAASKVKGLSSASCKRKLKRVKKMKCDGKNKHCNNNVRKKNKSKNFIDQQTNNRSGAHKKSQNYINADLKKIDGPFANFVLFVFRDHPVSLLIRNAVKNKYTISWDFHETEKTSSICSISLNGNIIATAEGNDKKMSRILAAKEAIKKLQSLCYTVKIKTWFISDNLISPAELGCPASKETSLQSSIGKQIMKLMGWTGGGLGANQDGIVDPISLHGNNGRNGLGNCLEDFEFRKKAKSFIRKWIKSNTDQDLVFTSEFSIEQRRTLHRLANLYSLKSKSYGKGKDRHLVVSRPICPWRIVEELMKAGGSSGKYELIVPDARK